MRVVAILFLGLLLVSCTDSGDEGEGTEAAREMNVVNVTVGDDSIEISGTVGAEPTTLIASNEGAVPHQVYLASLNRGVTEKDINKTLKKEGPDALFELITIAGSFPGEGTEFGRVSPGKTGELIIDFPKGTYMVIDPEVDGPPPFGFFQIPRTPGAGAPPEPEADYEIEVGEFYFEFDGTQAGPSVVRITNKGRQGHEVSIGQKIKSEDGEEVAFTFAPPPSGTLWTTFDLEPGTYDVACFFPDIKTDKTHLQQGMEATIEVK